MIYKDGGAMRQKERKNFVLRWATYIALIFLSYLFQITPRVFEIFSIKPLWLLSIAVCISVYESEITASVVGVICGLFMDISSGRIIGFNAAVLMVLCCGVSLLATYVMRINFISNMIVTVGACFLHQMTDYIFSFLIWIEKGSHKLLYTQYLPTLVYTAIITAFFYMLVKRIRRKFSN